MQCKDKIRNVGNRRYKRQKTNIEACETIKMDSGICLGWLKRELHTRNPNKSE